MNWLTMLYSFMVDLNIFFKAYTVLVSLCLQQQTSPNFPEPNVFPISNSLIDNFCSNSISSFIYMDAFMTGRARSCRSNLWIRGDFVCCFSLVVELINLFVFGFFIFLHWEKFTYSFWRKEMWSDRCFSTIKGECFPLWFFLSCWTSPRKSN